MLTKQQAADLGELQALANQFGAEVVIIGAAALGCFVELNRMTRDIDLVVALELEGFSVFARELTRRRWTREPRIEHRWKAPKGTLIDLLPAGPGLRASGKLVWPESEFEMSLRGFDHVFRRSVPVAVGGTEFRVVPPPVIALLKIVAYTEDRYRRQKDVGDLAWMLTRYEAESDRMFSDAVFDADLEDIEFANAFLLGLDVGGIAEDGDHPVIMGFLKAERVDADTLSSLAMEELEWEKVRFQKQLAAFQVGYEMGRANQRRKSARPR